MGHVSYVDRILGDFESLRCHHMFWDGENEAQRQEWLTHALQTAKAMGIQCWYEEISHHGQPGYAFGFGTEVDHDLFVLHIIRDCQNAPDGPGRYPYDYSFSGMPVDHIDRVRHAVATHLNAMNMAHSISMRSNGFTVAFDSYADNWLFGSMAARGVFEKFGHETGRVQAVKQRIRSAGQKPPVLEM